MIKDNQKSLNRFHVVLDACVTAFSYLLAWFIVIGSGWANQLGKRTLEIGFYFGALLVIIPAYLLLYSLFGLYTPKRVLGRRNEFGKIFKANSIGFLIFGLVLYPGESEVIFAVAFEYIWSFLEAFGQPLNLYRFGGKLLHVWL